MKLKNELQDIYDDLWNVYFCCYCLEPQGEKYHCCQENHFVPFADLYEEDQQYIIESEIGEAFGEQA